MPKRSLRTIPLIILIIALCARLPIACAKEPPLKIVFFDVGQGDSAAIYFPNGEALLVDAGAGKTDIVRKLRETGAPQSISILMTHPHSDHIGGMLPVVKEFNIIHAYDTGYPYSRIYENILNRLLAVNVQYSVVRSGQKFTFGEAQITILHPDEGFEPHDINDSSVVFMLRYRDFTALFTGDVEKVSEARMVKKWGKLLDADILKVGHHGSRYSSSRGFLSVVRPQFAVISLAIDNSYGYPHKQALAALEDSGAEIYRTDWHGDITVISDGRHIEISATER